MSELYLLIFCGLGVLAFALWAVNSYRNFKIDNKQNYRIGLDEERDRWNRQFISMELLPMDRRIEIHNLAAIAIRVRLDEQIKIGLPITPRNSDTSPSQVST